MSLQEKFAEGWRYLKDIRTRGIDKFSIIGPFKASIHLQGDTQRGILIPKEYHEESWFKDLLLAKKHKITIIVEDITED